MLTAHHLVPALIGGIYSGKESIEGNDPWDYGLFQNYDIAKMACQLLVVHWKLIRELTPS
jgi:hypothetical protein